MRITQGLGFTLAEIGDWERLSRRFAADIEERIAGLQRLQEKLTWCIGCGCLSLRRCRLHNPGDRAAALGNGPRYLLGDEPDDALGD